MNYSKSLSHGSALRLLKHKFHSVGKRCSPSGSVLPIGIQMRLSLMLDHFNSSLLWSFKWNYKPLSFIGL